MNQHDPHFLKPFFNLFYLESHKDSKDYYPDIYNKINIRGNHLDILVCGAGSGILEFPLLLSLFSNEEYKTANIIFIDKVKTPFKLLNAILQNYSKMGKKSIEIDVIDKYETYEDVELEKNYKEVSIAQCKVTYAFFEYDLEFNPNVKNQNYNELKKGENFEIREDYKDFLSDFIKKFNDNGSKVKIDADTFDIVIMSMLLQHLSYWRSLIAYTNFYLKENGFHFISEFGGDNFVLNLDIYRGIIEDKDKTTATHLHEEFIKLIREQFSIIGDNNELNSTNLEVCEHFFDFFGVKAKCSEYYKIESSITKEILQALFGIKGEPIFSPYKKYKELFEDNEENDIIERIKKIDDAYFPLTASFPLKWKFFKKIPDDREDKVYHFNVINKAEIVGTMSVKCLQKYITETLDILGINTTIFSTRFVTGDNPEGNKKVIEYTIELFARFILFRIDKTEIETLTFYINAFYINDIIAFPLVNTNNIAQQKKLLDQIKKYNEDAKNEKLRSINELFFDTYKNVFTKPFVVILDKDSDKPYRDLSFENNMHIVELTKLKSDLKTKFGEKIQEKLDEKKYDIQKLFAIYLNNMGIDKNIILVPCFRESFTNSNKIEKEFTATLILSYRKDAKDTKDAWPFYIWLIKKFIDFSNIGNAIDFSRYKAKLIQANTLSARSAIMARNLSHNLGSHVMAYLKHHLKSVESIVDSNLVLKELISLTDRVNNSKQWYENIKAKWDSEDYRELPFLVGLGRLISYLQERMDFIATVCTDYIPYFSTVNFKDDIYDELCLDARYCRHEIYGRHGEKSDNLLLKYIAQSERLERSIYKVNNDYYYKSNNIIIKFGEFNGLSIKHKDLTRMRDINFSLPGGITGRQAFCSIIENIIRNAAKHGERVNNQDLELTIDIFEKENIKGAFKKDYEKYDEIKNDDLYVITVTDNLPLKNGSIELLRKAINEPYVDNVGKMLETNKGIKEMRISAMWLRGISDYEEKIQPPVLNVYNYNEHLQYVFCVHKPKNIAFVKKDNSKSEDFEMQNNLKESHCKLYTVLEFKEALKINYQFVVAVEEGVFEQILPFSHSRTLEILNLSCYENINKTNISDKLLELYKQFVHNPQKIFISDTKGDNNISSRMVVRKDEAENITEKYLYKNHFDGEEKFDGFMKEYYEKIDNFKFIEGITGHNSTDRLLRNEEIDALWYYRHFNAMRTSVAIFDERLFAKISGQKTSEMLRHDDCLSDIINIKNQEDSIAKKIEKILKYDKTHLNIIEKNSMTSFFRRIQSKEKLNEFIAKYFIAQPVKIPNNQFFKTSTKLPYLYKLKGIQFFNLQKDDNCFNIYGYSKDLHNVDENNKWISYEGTEYGKIGTISKKIDDKGEISISIDIAAPAQFDYLSIHQGLLDKVYEAFEITKDDIINRDKTTEAIFRAFCKDPKTVKKRKEYGGRDYDFLPHFIIHSGRSKPSEKDMPQQQPFVQYAALENAVGDCKYTLVELLNSARYEQ